MESEWEKRFQRTTELAERSGMSIQVLVSAISRSTNLSTNFVKRVLSCQRNSRKKPEVIAAAASAIEKILQNTGKNEEQRTVMEIRHYLLTGSWTETQSRNLRSSDNALSAARSAMLSARAESTFSLHPLVERALFADEAALIFLECCDAEETCFGNNIEIRNWLRPNAAAIDNGLSGRDITIRRELVAFDNFDRTLIDKATINRLKSENRVNGVKLTLVTISPPDISDEGLKWVSFDMQDTDYFTIIGFLATIIPDQRLRHQNMNVRPDKNRIPGYFVLHYIVRFRDKKFLTIHRSDQVTFSQNRLSFSGEEQMTPEDIARGANCCDDWMVRSLMQEAFHYRHYALDSKEAEQIRSMIVMTKFLSLFLEEQYGQFGLMGFAQLNIDSDEYAAFYKKQIKALTGGIDNEGRRYLMDECELTRCLREGRCEVQRLIDQNKTIPIALDGVNWDSGRTAIRLHASSLYRMWKVCQLIGITG